MRFIGIIGLVVIAGFALSGCTARVGNGEVGVRYHTCGSDRGVEDAVLGMGYYLTGWCTDIENFSTFAQTRNWTNANGEAIHFADRDGLAITAEMGITYAVDPQKAPYLYKRYRRGIDEITDVFVHNMIKDTIIREASQLSISEIMGPKKPALLNAVQKDIIERVNPQGIIVQNVYWVGALDVPESVRNSVNSKIVATQRAQQIENEVAQTKAEAEKAVAEAEGKAKARMAQATAEADANKLIGASITPTLVEYMKINKWHGDVPRIMAGSSGTSFLLDTREGK